MQRSISIALGVCLALVGTAARSTAPVPLLERPACSRVTHAHGLICLVTIDPTGSRVGLDLSLCGLDDDEHARRAATSGLWPFRGWCGP